MEITSSGQTFGFEETLSLIKLVRDYASSVGVTMSPSSRIAQFESQLRHFGTMTVGDLFKPGVFDWDEFIERNRDTTELAFICNTLAEPVPLELKKWLRLILGGTRIPSQQSDTRSRDKQFELYVAALFAHSGFSISLDEPDVRFEHGGNWLGIAAKRISSVEQIEKRVRQARSQLARNGLHGYVALSLDCLVPRVEPPRIVSNPQALDMEGSKQIEDLLSNHGRVIAPLLSHSHCLGLIAICVLTAIVRETPTHVGIGTITTQRMRPRLDDKSTIDLGIAINSRLKGPV